MRIKAKWIIFVSLVMTYMIFLPKIGLSVTRNQISNSLDELIKGQENIQNMLSGRASKAGARLIIKLINDLAENNIYKIDIEDTIQTLQKDLLDLSNKVVNLSSQLAPQHRIQILAEIKIEQKNIKERLAELNEKVSRINTQYARNAVKHSQSRQADISKIVDNQSDITNIFSNLKKNIQTHKEITNRYLMMILFILIFMIAGITIGCYFYIKKQKQEKEEILEKTMNIVKEQYEHLLEQLYVEEHEDGRITADDLKKMSEQVKKRVVRQNWAKRKVEDRPAFI